jgi:protein O-GlcNAc transferase
VTDPSSSSAAFYDTALAAYQAGDLGTARAALDRALAGDPGSAPALHLSSALCLARGDFTGAVAAARQAAATTPKDLGIQNGLALALHAAGQSDEALTRLRALADDHPETPEPLANMAMVYSDSGRWTDALAAADAALRLEPRHPAALNNKAAVLQKIGAIESARDCLTSALAAHPDHPDLIRNMLTVIHYDPRATHQDIFDITRANWAVQPKPPAAARAVPASPQSGPLHVGFLSPDFRSHPVGRFLQPVLAGLDKARFRVTLYANQTEEDEVTRDLKQHASAWVPVKHLSDADAASRIAADGVDLLIELAGFSDNHRLGVMRRKPAPVQASWLGYVATTGLPEVDYVIADRYVWPERDDAYFVEQPMRLPDSYICFQPPSQKVAVGPPPMTRNGFVTFGSLNNTVKLNSVCLAEWGRILASVPGSKLLLKAHQLSDARVISQLVSMCDQAGISGDRLILLGRTSREDHLAAYNQVDLVLDPFPYGGGLTTAEALWMGVPVVTIAGDRWVARAGVSILSTVGLPQLIAANPEDYRNLAVGLAGNAGELASLRMTLRPVVESSPLSNSRRYVRDVEQTFLKMTERA